MKIYRIIPDVNDFQSIALNDESLWQTDMFTFDCKSKTKVWLSPKTYVLNPKLKEGDFPYLCPGALVVRENAINKILEYFEMSGELLPLTLESNTLSILNVLECINALNKEETEWKFSNRTGKKLRILKYSFHLNRIPEAPLFKIPETSKSEILTYSGVKDPDDEFITVYKKTGLKGLRFEKIWSS